MSGIEVFLMFIGVAVMYACLYVIGYKIAWAFMEWWDKRKERHDEH